MPKCNNLNGVLLMIYFSFISTSLVLYLMALLIMPSIVFVAITHCFVTSSVSVTIAPGSLFV